jgi:hypothetical protein
MRRDESSAFHPMEILFEAPLTMASIEGKNAAAEAIAMSAERICESVE